MEGTLYILGASMAFIGLLAATLFAGARSGEGEPFSQSCREVTESTFFRLLGIPLDAYIFGYFLLLVSFFFVNIFTEGVVVHLLSFSLSVAGFMGALYFCVALTVAVERWCMPALMLLSLVALSSALGIANTLRSDILDTVPTAVFDAAGLTALILTGIGAALSLMSFATFLSFMSDLKITRTEARILHVFSDGAWVVLIGSVSATATFFWFQDIHIAVGIPSLLLGVLSVIAFSEAVKSMRVYPRLVLLSVVPAGDARQEREFMRGIAFTLEIIPVVSWFFAVWILFDIENVNVVDAVATYVVLIVISFFISQLIRSRTYDG